MYREFDYQLASAIKKHQAEYKYCVTTRVNLMMAVMQGLIKSKPIETITYSDIEKAIEEIWSNNN